MKLLLQQRLKMGGLLLILLIGSFAFGQTTVTYSFSGPDDTLIGLNEGAPGITVDPNIGFGTFKNLSGTDPRMFGNQFRLYQNATKGGSIRIYPSNGVTITKVVVYASGSGTGPAGYNVDSGAETNISISGGAYTMSDLTATSRVEFYSKGTNSSTRVYVDSFEVTYISGGNTGPEITNIIQAPDANEVSSADTVLVSADITDDVAVASAFLYWGTASGVLPNEIEMIDIGGYYIDSEIPAQAENTTVFYEIRATDGDAEPITTISDEQSYTVTDPAPAIANIEQDPVANEVSTQDLVQVIADITTTSGTITAAKLHWGTASGVLSTTINMTLLGSDSYWADSEIPVQLEGTTIYYEIEATNSFSKAVTSAEQSYTVKNPVPVIANIAQDPMDGSVTPADDVLVTVDITSLGGSAITAANLNWGTASGSLTNPLALEFDTGDTYYQLIPAQEAGAQVFYEIVATNGASFTTTSPEQSYTVNPLLFPEPYCGPIEFDYDVEPITLVQIAGIDNASSATTGGFNDHEDFTAFEGTMERGQSYTITLKGNTNGDFANRFVVFIDWNQDHDFDDAGEVYDITTLLENSTGEDSEEVTWQIDVPMDALVGGTRMRVKKTWGSSAFLDPCVAESGYGQVEDYTINVIAGVRPFIANIVQDPSGTVTSEDAVTVSADITDETGIASAKLLWGTVTGTLTNEITMTLGAENNYSAVIPAQADGTTVYYAIEAIDTDAVPNTTISLEQSYAVEDPIVFEIPYINGFRTTEAYNEAVDLGFVFNNATHATAAGGYVHIEQVGGNIVTPAIDFSAFDELTVNFSMTTFGSGSDRQLTVFYSNDNGASYNSLDPITVGNYSPSITQVIDLTSLNGTAGLIKFEMTAGSAGGVRFRDLEITGVPAIDGYLFDNGTWSPSDPSGVATAMDNITVLSGTASFTENTTVNNIVINSGATLNIENVLTIAGDITIDGDLVFVSSATGNGELAAVPGTSTITGNATVQRYMQNKRSYRMVSPAVTTTTSIHDNWQEGATSNTHNPAPGFGTHITGSQTDQMNGFDGTGTGAPSMYYVPDGNQAFAAIGNTDLNTLTAGSPYLMMVRGDRAVDLTDNNAHSATTLRATGVLVTGEQTQSFTAVAEDFVMFGNPYQSAVDIVSVFANSTNLNTNFVYLYDPNNATHGGYETVDLSEVSPNQYLQPGQAAQVKVTGAATIRFNESDKAPGNFTTMMRNTTSGNDRLTVQLYTTENFNNNGPLHDSFIIRFAEGNDNGLTSTDAVKPMNFYENLGINHDGTYLSIERREMPGDAEVYPLYSSGYNYTDYTLKMKIDGLDDSIFYLDDHFTQTSTLLDGRETAYNFTVDKNDPLSIDTGRFAIRTEARLDVNDNNMLAGIRLYPNPLNDNTFYINVPNLNGKQLDVNINDLSGRVIYKAALDCQNNMVVVPMKMDIASGIYLVTLNHGGEAQTLRLIKN